MYNTLQELADSGVLSSGDTVILHNDDSSLTSGLTVAVNFRSNDPDTSRTIDLAKLGGGDCLYRFNFNPFRPGSSGDPDISGVLDVNGVVTLMLDSIILSNGCGLQMDEYALATKIIGDIQFKNSSGRAAIYAENVVYDVNASLRRAISLTLEDNTVFSNNDRAIAICDTRIAIGDNAIFSGNRDDTEKDGGGAIWCRNGGIIIGDNALFSGNYVDMDSRDSWGGVFLDDMGGSTITVGENAIFIGNYVSSNSGCATGGVMWVRKYGLYDNVKDTGAISMGANATFINNYAFSDSGNAFGGVIYSDADISFSDGATFINNYAKTSGGAIELGGKLDLFALTKDVLFSGNMTGGVFTRHDDGSFSVENGIANAINFEGRTSTLTFAAEKGREIRFNDPITGRSETSDRPMTLTLNRCTDEEGNIHDTDGTIIFSSELYQGEEAHLVASRYNNFVADTTLYGGTLLLEHGAVFGRNLEDMRNLGNDSSSLTVEKGTLEIIGGSTANAAAFSLSGRDAVLRPGDSAFINANTADFSRGFTFDMRHQLQSGPGSGPGLTLSAAQSFTAGGGHGLQRPVLLCGPLLETGPRLPRADGRGTHPSGKL